MALSADQKEAIMAARGESAAAPVVKSKTRRYQMEFADGKRATVLDMAGEDPEVAMAGITRIFHPGYVVQIQNT